MYLIEAVPILLVLSMYTNHAICAGKVPNEMMSQILTNRVDKLAKERRIAHCHLEDEAMGDGQGRGSYGGMLERKIEEDRGQ